jgi:hypothetical protein
MGLLPTAITYLQSHVGLPFQASKNHDEAAELTKCIDISFNGDRIRFEVRYRARATTPGVHSGISGGVANGEV